MKKILLAALAVAALAAPPADAGRVPEAAMAARKAAPRPHVPQATTAAQAAPPVACVSSPDAQERLTICTDSTTVPQGQSPTITVTMTVGRVPVPDGTPLFVWGSERYGPVRFTAVCVISAGACTVTPRGHLTSQPAAVNFYAQHFAPGGVQTPGHGLTVAYV